MQHRFRMYWFTDTRTPLGPGRPLFGSSPEEAIERAADLWEEEGPPVRALGCKVVDTEDGTVVWQRQREGDAVVPPLDGSRRLGRGAAWLADSPAKA